MSKFAPEQWHERTLQEGQLGWQGILLVNVQTTSRTVRYHSYQLIGQNIVQYVYARILKVSWRDLYTTAHCSMTSCFFTN